MRDCWEEGGRKEGQGPKQNGKGKGKGKSKEKGKEKEKEAAASATDDKKPKEEKPKDEEAWMVMMLEDTPQCMCSHQDFDDLCIDLLYEEAYSCFIDDEALAYSLPELDPDISSFDGNVDHSLSAWISNMEICTNLEYAHLVGTKDTCKGEVDLYDSGATQHMSGFFQKFINFITINLIPIYPDYRNTS